MEEEQFSAKPLVRSCTQSVRIPNDTNAAMQLLIDIILVMYSVHSYNQPTTDHPKTACLPRTHSSSYPASNFRIDSVNGVAHDFVEDHRTLIVQTQAASRTHTCEWCRYCRATRC